MTIRFVRRSMCSQAASAAVIVCAMAQLSALACACAIGAHPPPGAAKYVTVVIDLHCHLLPGVDDGAADMEDSIALARQGEEDGVLAICATPHIRHDHDVRIHELPQRLAAVQAALDREGVAVRALPGGEVAQTALPGLDDSELRAVTLGGGGRWILLEPAPGPLALALEDAVGALAHRGFDAVVAHPERHVGADFFERVRALVRGRRADPGDGGGDRRRARWTDPPRHGGRRAGPCPGIRRALGARGTAGGPARRHRGSGDGARATPAPALDRA